MKGVYFGIAMGKGATTPAPDSWSSTLAVSPLSDGNNPKLSTGDKLIFDDNGRECSISLSTIAGSIALALPTSTGTFALTSDITSLATADQTVDVAERTVTLNGDLSTDKIRFENASGDLILELRGDKRLFSGDGSSLWFGQGTGAKHTTGYQNTLFGHNVGGGLTGGYINTGVGYQALWSATAAYANTAIGRYTLRGLVGSNGYNNTANGASAGQYLTAGYNNVLSGYNAGLKYGAGAGTNCTLMYDSVIIGVGSRPSGNAEFNQIVIGKSAIGNGTDTATIGDLDVADLYVGTTLHLYQETNAIAAAAFVANTSGIADDTATWGGYTAGQVVAALQAHGLLQ